MEMATLTPGRVRRYDGVGGEPTPLDVPLAAITRIAREKVLLGRDHLRISTGDVEYVFTGGWDVWAWQVRRQLTGVLRREVVEETPELWHIASGA